MRERPILFSGPMVAAILAGRKTQTRRVIQSPARNMQREGMEVIKYRPPGDPWYRDYVWSMRGPTGVWGDYTHERFLSLCPYGAPGERLWVRETWSQDCGLVYPAPGVWYRATDDIDTEVRRHVHCNRLYRRCDHGPSGECFADFRWRPSIHMPRWASRLLLEVTEVRVQRLQDITEGDARAEGVETVNGHPERGAFLGIGPCFREGFAQVWADINGSASWDANPWVWCVSFKRAEVPHV